MAEKWFEYATYMNNKVAQLQQLDSSWTLAKVEAAFKDAGFAGIEGAYNHFVQYGADEDVSPNALFNAESYYASKAANYFNVSPASNVSSDQVLYIKGAFADAGLNAWTHYIQYGTKEGINPSNNFDTAKYLEAKAAAMGMTVDQVADAISAAGMNALTHAILYSGQGSQEAASIFNDDGSVNEAYAVPDEEKTNVNTDSGQTYSLTMNQDTFTGTTGDDLFSAVDHTGDGVAGQATWTVGDTLDGGAGNDTFSIVTTGGLNNAPAGATVSNIENVEVTTNGNVVLNTTSFTGLEKLNVTTSAGGQNLTAAESVDVTSTATGAGGSAFSVKGGKDVTLSATANNNGTVLGNVTVDGAAGAVDVTTKYSQVTTTSTLNNVNVTGGTTVNVTQDSGWGNTTAQSGAINSTVEHGTVTVNGSAATTEVTVTQDKAVQAIDGSADDVANFQVKGKGTIGVTNNDVTISDVNASSTTDAGTITTVTVNNADDVNVTSSALTTLNLNGSVTTATVAADQLSTAAVTEMALNLNGVSQLSGITASGGQEYKNATAVTVKDTITTLNLAGAENASIITLDDAKLETLNVSGDAKITVNAGSDAIDGNSNLKAVTVTNTAGFDMSKAGTLDKDATFTGGAGADGVKLDAAFATDVAMGAGNDVVDYTAQGTGLTTYKGTVDGGAGTDTIKLTSAFLEDVAGTAAKEEALSGAFTNFEGLHVNGASAMTKAFDMTLLGSTATALTVNTTAANTVMVTGMANTGGTVNLTNTGAFLETLNIDFATAKGSHSVTVTLDDTADDTNFGTVAFTGNGGAVKDVTVTLNTGADKDADPAAQQILFDETNMTGSTLTITGSNGVVLGQTVAFTTVDASGISVADGAVLKGNNADYGVTLDAHESGEAVSFTGGIGNDTYTASASGDTVKLSSGGSDAVHLSAYAAGYDGAAVTGFSVGEVAADKEGDVFAVTDINAAINAANGAVVTTKDATLADTYTYIVDFGAAVKGLDFEGTTADFEKLFNDTGKTWFHNTTTGAAKAVVVVQGTDMTQVLYVDTADAALDKSDVHLIGTLDVTNSDTFVAENLGLTNIA